MELEKMTADVPEFTLYGAELKGKIVEMYDGDTCKIVMSFQNVFYKFVCRLNGIDTPELKPRKDNPNRDNIILQAKKARAELLKMVCGNIIALDNLNITKDEINNILANNTKLVIVKCMEFDKYGRILVDIYNNIDDISLNMKLVNMGLAVLYDGGHKN